MKKILTLFIVPLLLCGVSVVQAQSECSLYISPDFDSDCLLTEYFKNNPLLWEPDMEDCLLACKGNTVRYTAVCPNGTQYTWNISGASSYLLTNQDRTAVVTWGTYDVGSISVNVVTDDSNTCTAEVCVLLMASPQAASSTIPNYYIDPNNNNKVIEVCKDETIELMDMSVAGQTPIVGCFWDTPFGNASSLHHTITATQSGGYTIQHRVINECGCEDIETYTLRVQDPITLDLSCYGTVCRGSEATYTLNDPACSQYNWSVEGGSYTPETPDSSTIHVQWGSPASGYGIVSIDAAYCNSPCPALAAVRIPVISDNVQISGPDVVCVGDMQLYELPVWGSTDYQWQITNSASTWTYMTNTEEVNQTLVEFDHVDTYQLTAQFECEFLSCGPFEVSKTIVAKDTFSIQSSDNTLCIGATGQYTTRQGYSVEWQVYDTDNLLVCQTSSSALTYTFTQAGRYRVVASSNSYCRDAEYWVTVLDGPPALTSSSGPHEACPYSSIELNATPTHPNYYLEWQPVCCPSTQIGDAVTIGYGSTVCDVRVYQVDAETGCRSSAYIHTVDTFQLAPHNLPYITDTCAGSTVYFSVPDQSENVIYKWTVSPANAASVVGDHLQPSVSILTNHLTTATTHLAYVTLERTYCTNLIRQETVIIRIHEVETPSLVYDSVVCENTPATFTAIGGSGVSNHYTWHFSDTTLVFHGANFSRRFPEGGNVDFTMIYQPDDACDSVTVQGSLFVRERHPGTLIYSNDTLRTLPVQGFRFQWTYNGDSICDTHYCAVSDTTGEYCCMVVYENAPSCPKTECFSFDPSPVDTCLNIALDTVRNCNEVVVHALNPSNVQFEWGISTLARGSHITSCPPDSAIAHFYVPGIHRISVSAESNGQCYSGGIQVTIDCVPKFELSYDCNGEIRVEDKSLYRTGYAIPDRTYSITGGGSVTLTGGTLSGIINIGTPTIPTTYTVNLTMDGSDCTYTDSITVEPDPIITSVDIPSSMCENTPFLFSATATGSGLLYHWDFGDGSYNYGNAICHTYQHNIIPYLISLTILNSLGCMTTETAVTLVFSHNLNGQIEWDDFSSVCPGDTLNIQYNPYLSSSLYVWTHAGISTSPSNNNQYPSTETGNYKVLVTDSLYGCRLEHMRNVGFLNAPTARITGSTRYCMGDEVKLNGNTGTLNQYSWNIAGPDNHTFSTANIAFTPSLAGIYYDTLTVTSADGCVATATDTIIVYAQPSAPPIAFFGNECIHTPPVGVHSTAQHSLLWSNGFHGDSAFYYTPGYLTAHYIDSITGCPSENSQLFIPPAPYYDALLTGCCQICEGELPTTLNVFNLYPYSSSSFQWHWFEDGNPIQSDTTLSPQLPVNDFSEYYLEADYGNGCTAKSPTLTIENRKVCPCGDISASVSSKKCILDSCMLTYGITIKICNDGDQSVTFNSLVANGNSDTISVTTLPVTIPPHDCRSIYAVIQFMDFATGFVSFTLYDSVRNCEVAFSEYFDWDDCISSNCTYYINKILFMPDLSTQYQASYFHFNVSLPAYVSGVVCVWSTPSQITYGNFYAPPATLEGFIMLDYGQLTQLAAEGGIICVDAILCLNTGELCHIQFCFDANDLLSAIPDEFRHAENPPSDEPGKNLQLNPDAASPDNTPYLVPNPARDEVTVMGLAPESVAEIIVLTMDGRQTAVFRNDCRFNVSNLAKATYIVRVFTTGNKVYYLKLVK